MDSEDVYFDFEKILETRVNKKGKKQAKIKWSKLGGVDFKPLVIKNLIYEITI